MSIEGKIHIRLDPGSDCPVHIQSSRPGEVGRLFEGLSADEVLTRLPALYGLCGHAQGLAGRQAFAALGLVASPSRAQWEATRCEALQALLWLFLIDLPRRQGLEPALATFAPVHGRLRRFSTDSDEARGETLAVLESLLARELLGMPVARWQAEAVERRQTWLQRFPAPVAVRLRALNAQLERLPAPSAPTALMAAAVEGGFLRELGTGMLAADFCRRPHWQGSPRETGPLSDHQHDPWLAERLAQRMGQGADGVVTRLLARLLETVAVYRQLAEGVDGESLCGSLRLDETNALGWVRTARGLLVHRVRMSASRVDDYRILAPTDWNFHPRGALYRGLENWLEAPPEALEEWVALQVLSLDPCVSYEFEVSHA